MLHQVQHDNIVMKKEKNMITNQSTQNLFIVILSYQVPLEKIDEYRPAHLEYLDRYYEKKIFIVSGRQNPSTGGVIIARCENKEKLEQILHEDPFSVHNLATYEIYEFTPTKFSDNFKEIIS